MVWLITLFGIYLPIAMFVSDVLKAVPKGSEKRRYWIALILFTGPIGIIAYMFRRDPGNE